MASRLHSLGWKKEDPMRRIATLGLALSALTLTACTKNDDTPTAETAKAATANGVEQSPQARGSDSRASTSSTQRTTKPHQTPTLDGSSEARFRSAISIVKSRGVGRYVQAAEMLKTIPASSSRYAEAQAYLEWIQADGMVRSATRCYHRGQVRRAFALLKQASAVKALGPSAHDSIKQRQLLWGRVIRSTHRAEKLIKDGKKSEAAIHLRYVVKLERNRRNAFRNKAKRLLRTIG